MATPLTSQTKLTLTLNAKTKLTLERGTNPTKPYYTLIQSNPVSSDGRR